MYTDTQDIEQQHCKYTLQIEFGVVIGKLGKNIPEDEAMEWVAGYALALDMTARYKGLQLHTYNLAKVFFLTLSNIFHPFF